LPEIPRHKNGCPTLATSLLLSLGWVTTKAPCPVLSAFGAERAGYHKLSKYPTRFLAINGQPRQNLSRRGSHCASYHSAKGPVSRILCLCGHSSRRRVAADAHQRPTRRFRQGLEPPGRAGQARNASLALGSRIPPYLVLLRVGFTLPPALQPERCAFTAPFHPYPGTETEPAGQAQPAVSGSPATGLFRGSRGVAEAVSFLWHWPSASLEARIPDVIRHTALRSSDFPPPVASRLREKSPAATARSSCQSPVYLEYRSGHAQSRRPAISTKPRALSIRRAWANGWDTAALNCSYNRARSLVTITPCTFASQTSAS
jgi:hypothetical protein